MMKEIKSWIKRIVPPRLLDAYRALRKKDTFYWDGIYRTFKDVPARGQYDNAEWISGIFDYTKKIADASSRGGPISGQFTDEHALLPLLVSLLSRCSGKITILDWGGGMGIDYLALKSCLADPPKISYHVIETKGMGRKGTELFRGDDQIQFHTDVPANLIQVDVVYICSAIQYAENYHDVLKTLCGLKARYLFFVKLGAGDMPTFASAQINIPNAVIPCWFLNAEEVIRILKECGYGLIYRSASVEYKQGNFPESHRFSGGRACNLLFAAERSDGKP